MKMLSESIKIKVQKTKFEPRWKQNQLKMLNKEPKPLRPRKI